ncbi:MAG: hypothetical protein PVI75_02890 [Gammaproteobacteria bacterium]|jgi:hypothetical protein
MNNYKLTMLIILASGISLLSGCATNASINNMIIRKKMNRPLVSKSLRQNVVVNQVTGGHKTNPLWISKIDNNGFKRALEESLKAVDLYGYKSSRYRLNANLIKLKQPLIGLNLTVVCGVNYKLTDVISKKIIYKRTINTSYTAKFTDDLLASMRLRDANEGAARKNITALITDLYKLNIRHVRFK